MRVCLLLVVASVVGVRSACGENWYERGFYLLHEDHHTSGTREVGRDADPVETARLINLSRPDVIQIHAKGNPGWTTYPSQVGYTPPLLKRDVMQVWRDIADKYHYPLSVYYNLGRDGEIMKRHPEWNRSDARGREIDRALCYHSGVAEAYLWPMVREIMDRYHPQGWWFDGSCFTVRLCYCDQCRERFKREAGADPPTKPSDPNWPRYHEMQRQIYREMIHKTAALIHDIDPRCLVSVNWAYSLRMPEKPDREINYLTGDIGNRVEGLSSEAHWYDGTGLPFDLMTQLCTMYDKDADGGTLVRPRFGPKSPVQIQQEMAIIIANGGRFWAWDSPTPESGLTPTRHEYLARHVAPWLKVRKPWCLGTTRLPDVSLLNTATAHYAVTDATGTTSFTRRNNRLEGAVAQLPPLHLNYEMVGQWRLHDQDIHSRVLIVEHPKRLTGRDVASLRDYVRGGGTLLLTGMGLGHGNGNLLPVFGLKNVVGPRQAERLTVKLATGRQAFDHHLFRFEMAGAQPVLTALDAEGDERPIFTRHSFGRGTAWYFATPLLAAHGKNVIPPALMKAVFDHVVPAKERLVTTNAPETVEVVLRAKGLDRILHLVNMATGTRQVYEGGRRTYVNLSALPLVPLCKIRLRTPQEPREVLLQPQNTRLDDWQYVDGCVEANIPAFKVHQMIVVRLGE